MSEEAKHTPGPWRQSTNQGGQHGIQDEVGNYIAFTALPYRIEQRQREGEAWFEMMARLSPEMETRDLIQDANGRLIAAAPELLEALEVLLEEYQDRKCQFGDSFLWEKHEDPHALEEAKAAIAKATGKEDV